jgi:CRISPR-associated protein Csd1
MMAAGDDQTQSPDCLSCQLIKAWLIRIQRERNEEVTVSEKVNPLIESTAYHLGRMMAVYASIQLDALGPVNAGVVERYYGAAVTSPALVLGRLSTLCNHHLAKMDNQRYRCPSKSGCRRSHRISTIARPPR